MAPLFSKVDLNKLWHEVQNEETLIFAKFGKDLFNISKVIGRKKVAQFFLTHSVYTLYVILTTIGGQTDGVQHYVARRKGSIINEPKEETSIC